MKKVKMGIIEKFGFISLMSFFLILLFNFMNPQYAQAVTKTHTEYFWADNGFNQSRTIYISDMQGVLNVKTTSDSVTYSINGKYLTLNVNGCYHDTAWGTIYDSPTQWHTGWITYNTQYIVTVEYTDNNIPTITPLIGNDTFSISLPIKATLKDADSGDILTVKYSIDKGEERTLSGTIVSNGSNQNIPETLVDISALAEGNHTLNIWVVDNRGGTSQVQSQTFIKDITSPVCANLMAYVNGTNQITVQANATDNYGLNESPYYFNRNGSDIGTWQSSNSYTDTGLLPNTLYDYKFKSRDKVGNISQYSNTYSVYTYADKPDISATANGPTSITLIVSDNNPSLTEYQVMCGTQYVNQNGSLTNSAVWITMNNKSTIVNGLNRLTKYTFKIKARNGNYMETTFSNTTEVTTSDALPVITINSPVNEGTFSAPFAIKFDIRDTFGQVTQTQVKIGSTTYYTNLNTPKNTEIAFSLSLLDFILLPNGTNKVTITAINELGGSATTTFSFMKVLIPPAVPVILTQEYYNQSELSDVKIKAQVSSAYNTNLVVDLYIDDELKNRKTISNTLEPATFAFDTLNLGSLEYGTHEIRVDVKDVLTGLRTTASKSFDISSGNIYKIYDFSSTADLKRKNYLDTTLTYQLTDSNFNYWYVESNELFGNTLEPINSSANIYSSRNNSIAIAGSDIMTDYIIESTFEIYKGCASYVVRYDKTKDTFYEVAFNDEDNKIEVYECSNISSKRLIKGIYYDIEPNVKYQILINVKGSDLVISVKENSTYIEKINITGIKLNSGMYGFKVGTKTKAAYSITRILTDSGNESIQAFKSISISPMSKGLHKKIELNSNLKLTVIGEKPDGTRMNISDNVEYSVSDKNICNVDSTGLVYAKGIGVCRITTIIGSVTDYVDIEVSPQAILITSNFNKDIPETYIKSGSGLLEIKEDDKISEKIMVIETNLNEKELVYDKKLTLTGNFTVATDMKINHGNTGLIICYNANTNSYYRISMSTTGISVQKVINGNTVNTELVGYSLNTNKYYNLKVVKDCGELKLYINNSFVGVYSDSKTTSSDNLLKLQSLKYERSINKNSTKDFIYDIGTTRGVISYYILLKGTEKDNGTLFVEKFNGRSWVVLDKVQFDFSKKMNFILEGYTQLDGKGRLRFSGTKYLVDVVNISKQTTNVTTTNFTGGSYKTPVLEEGYYNYNFKVKGKMAIDIQYFDGTEWVSIPGFSPVQVNETKYKEYNGIIGLPMSSQIRVVVTGSGAISNMEIIQPLKGGYIGFVSENDSAFIKNLQYCQQ